MNKRITGLLTALTIAATPIALPARAADTDPAYRVYMARDGTSYTAEVTLENIAAMYGTFGIKYDPTLPGRRGHVRDKREQQEQCHIKARAGALFV